ncbi:MAG: DUF4188 domain-containing protein [Bacteroidota bacterium]
MYLYEFKYYDRRIVGIAVDCDDFKNNIPTSLIMHITVTSLKLKRLWHFFILANYAFKVTKQMRNEKGFLSFKNKGLGRMQYTLSAWESEEDLKRFARSGAHKTAMQKTNKIASEVNTLTYQSDIIPDWKAAKDLLLTKGKVIKFT